MLKQILSKRILPDLVMKSVLHNILLLTILCNTYGNYNVHNIYFTFFSYNAYISSVISFVNHVLCQCFSFLHDTYFNCNQDHLVYSSFPVSTQLSPLFCNCDCVTDDILCHVSVLQRRTLYSANERVVLFFKSFIVAGSMPLYVVPQLNSEAPVIITKHVVFLQ